MSNDTKPQKRIPWRTIVLVLILVVVAGGAGLTLRLLQSPDYEPLTELPEAVSDAQNLRLGGDSDGADKKIQESLDNPSLDDKTRYELHIQKGHIFVEKKDYQAAIESYKAAEQVDATSSVAWLIGDIYIKMENKVEAVEYYKKAIERIPADDPLADADREYLQSLVQNLEAGQQ